jgi:chemotaxis protein MotD
MAAQSFPAPAPAPANQTITALAGAIATGSGTAPTLSASAGLTLPAQPVAAASHLMKIEVHPAELGVVTANLRLAGGQLSIELKPENQEAHRRLSADSDALVKALQGLGFTIDKVTVLQPIVAVTATPRMDAPAGSTGRDPSSFQPGNSGGNGDPAGGQQFGRNRGNEGQHGGNGGAPLRDRAGGGLFI